VIYWLIALAALVLDQWTKRLIVNNMEVGDVIPVLGNFFTITSHRNRGAAWGILQDQRLFFIVFTIVVTLGLVWYLVRSIREGRRMLPFGLSLLLGGALGNFVDRVRTGEVVDFFHFIFDFKPIGIPFVYDFPIFNVADSCIVVGIIVVAIDTLFAERKQKTGVSA
jgi:signal peptidase II